MAMVNGLLKVITYRQWDEVAESAGSGECVVTPVNSVNAILEIKRVDESPFRWDTDNQLCIQVRYQVECGERYFKESQQFKVKWREAKTDAP